MGNTLAERLTRAGDRLYDALRHKQAFEITEAQARDGGFGALRRHKYAVLVTFRRNGEPVPSPVWFAIDEAGNAYIRTAAASGKVKRIRNDSRVLIAPSTRRGKPVGPVIRGTARVLGPVSEHGEATLAAAYGRGRKVYTKVVGEDESHGAYIEITPGR